MRKKHSGYLYIIRIPQFNYYKIGVSTNIKNRLYSIKTNIPYEIELVALYESDDIFCDEIMMHSNNTKHRFKGEWFKFTKRDACNAIYTLISKDKDLYIYNKTTKLLLFNDWFEDIRLGAIEYFKKRLFR